MFQNGQKSAKNDRNFRRFFAGLAGWTTLNVLLRCINEMIRLGRGGPTVDNEFSGNWHVITSVFEKNAKTSFFGLLGFSYNPLKQSGTGTNPSDRPYFGGILAELGGWN